MIAKVPKSPVLIPERVTLNLSASTVMLILDALGEKPYKFAQGAIAEIEPQILAQQVIEGGRPGENDSRAVGTGSIDHRRSDDLYREGEKGQGQRPGNGKLAD